MPYRTESTFVCVDSCIDICGSSISISESGELYTFGISVHGANGYKEKIFPPKVIPSLIDIRSVKCGLEHTICLDILGNVFTFGSNTFGQLGIGIDKKTLPQTCEPQKVNLPPIKQISCGSKFNMCISEDHEAFYFGKVIQDDLCLVVL